MEVENLVKASVDEIQKVLSSTSVMGEPKTIEGVTLIPLISTGFLFAAGGGAGKADTPGKGEGEGGGTGGGVGIKPIAVVIIDNRLDPPRLRFFLSPVSTSGEASG